MESKEEEGTLGCSHGAPGEGSAAFPTPPIPWQSLQTTRPQDLRALSWVEELTPENVTGCAASPAPPEELSLRDGEKIGDLMLV